MQEGPPDTRDETADSAPDADLARAYQQRTAQLHEARTALADVVSTIKTELARRTEELDRMAADNRALREQVASLQHELELARADVRALQQMKVVRWTAWPRGVVYRLRARRG